jgi:hypothetical protein
MLVNLANIARLVQITHMGASPLARYLTAPLLLLSLGCQSSPETHAAPNAGGSGTGGAQNLAGGATLPPGTETTALLPARIRRLADAEYQASVSALFNDAAAAQGIAQDFVPDSRQSGFTLNEAQRVDPVLAAQLADAAIKLAAELRAHASERAPCASPATEADACATAFITSFGLQAYRRPLADDEVAQLLTVFHTALDGGSYDEGIELVTRAMLQSAGFLYLTEIGPAPAATVELTPYEVAASISFLIQGRPPSRELLTQVKDLSADGARQALLSDPNLFGPAARERVVRVIREWLGTDRVTDLAKDSTIYPDFALVKADMAQETTAFIQELVQAQQGSLRQLLAADWTVANGNLAQKGYGKLDVTGDFQRLATPDRLGILNQGAFLSVFAHAHETAPVLRGVAVMRRIACSPVGDPVGLTSAVVPPAPDPSKTTRARFAAHAVDTCAACHNRIDNFGFAFEGFDGMGRSRPTDNGQAVDASVTVTGTDFDGSYSDSNGLVKAMSTSNQVRECFARHMFRALATSSADAIKPSEDDFVRYWAAKLPQTAGQVDDVGIIDTLLAYVQSPAFIYRRAQ